MVELMKIIKTSKCPIICICNDRQSPKVRSLASASYDLKVRRPTKTQIATRLVEIARKEGLQVGGYRACVFMSRNHSLLLCSLYRWSPMPRRSSRSRWATISAR